MSVVHARPVLRRTVLAAAAAVTVTLALAPLLVLAVTSVARGWYWPELVPEDWTLRAWRYAFSPSSEVLASLMLSVVIAVVVTVLAVVVAVPAARALALHRFAAKPAVLFLLLLPVIAPPLASAMGVHSLFVRLGLADAVTGVVLVHLIPALPYATLMLMGSFSAFEPDVEAQARTLGAPWWRVWLHVTLPAVAPGLAVAAAFAFLVSWSQYLTTLFIGGGRVMTLPLTLVVFQRSGDQGLTAALSLIFMAPAVLVFTVVAKHLQDHA